MKTTQSDLRVFVLSDGVAMEIFGLPEETIIELSEAYDEAPIIGLSYETYMALVGIFARKIAKYQEEMKKLDVDNVYAKTVAFARAFEIYPEESPLFFEMLLQIERRIEEDSAFSSKTINVKCLRSMINANWSRANKDFRIWAKKLFEDTGLKIGIIRMSKFFYGIATTQLA